MNLVEETKYRLKCCKSNTNDGYGHVGSLRNILMPVTNRIKELKKLSLWLKNKDVLDNVELELQNEYEELIEINKQCKSFLRRYNCD